MTVHVCALCAVVVCCAALHVVPVGYACSAELACGQHVKMGTTRNCTHLAAKRDHGYIMYGRVNERKKQRRPEGREVALGKGKMTISKGLHERSDLVVLRRSLVNYNRGKSGRFPISCALVMCKN